MRKKALIIDVRGNGGGNVSPMLIERLRREIAMINIARNTAPDVDPGGHDLRARWSALMNEFSASDGDLFPYRFKQYKLGKLIGKRTWGGVVGIRGSLPLLDGGYLNQARVLALRRGRQEVDHRGPRRRSGHRGGQRPGPRVSPASTTSSSGPSRSSRSSWPNIPSNCRRRRLSRIRASESGEAWGVRREADFKSEISDPRVPSPPVPNPPYSALRRRTGPLFEN